MDLDPDSEYDMLGKAGVEFVCLGRGVASQSTTPPPPFLVAILVLVPHSYFFVL